MEQLVTLCLEAGTVIVLRLSNVLCWPRSKLAHFLSETAANMAAHRGM